MENNTNTPSTVESLIIDEGTLEFDIIQRLRNDGLTSVQRRFNADATAEQPGRDDSRTAEQRQRDTDNANDNRPEPPTDAEIVAANADLVRLLKNRAFVKKSTNNKYRCYLRFYDNVPKSLVQAVNKIGITRADGREHTRETISRVVTAMKITRRFRPLSFYAAMIATAITVSFATVKLYDLYQLPVPNGGYYAAALTPTPDDAADVETLIANAAQKANVPVYPYRINKIKQEIELSQDKSLKTICLIIDSNINELLKLNIKKHL